MHLFVHFIICWTKMIQPHKLMYGYNLIFFHFHLSILFTSVFPSIFLLAERQRCDSCRRAGLMLRVLVGSEVCSLTCGAALQLWFLRTGNLLLAFCLLKFQNPRLYSNFHVTIQSIFPFSIKFYFQSAFSPQARKRSRTTTDCNK